MQLHSVQNPSIDNSTEEVLCCIWSDDLQVGMKSAEVRVAGRKVQLLRRPVCEMHVFMPCCRGDPPPATVRAFLLEAQATYATGVLAAMIEDPQTSQVSPQCLHMRTAPSPIAHVGCIS